MRCIAGHDGGKRDEYTSTDNDVETPICGLRIGDIGASSYGRAVQHDARDDDCSTSQPNAYNAV